MALFCLPSHTLVIVAVAVAVAIADVGDGGGVVSAVAAFLA